MNEENHFTAEQLEKNNRNKQNLIKLIASGDATLMAGAGSSASIYPDWLGFANKMCDAAKGINPDFDDNMDDYTLFFNRVKDCIGEHHYNHLIHEEFRPRDVEYKPFHEILCRLPFKGFTTTNYDVVLEAAMVKVTGKNSESMYLDGQNNAKVHEFFQSLLSQPRYPRRVFHLHGKYDVPQSIILCEREYTSKYGFKPKTPVRNLYDEVINQNITREQLDQLLYDYGYEWPIRRKIIWSLLATQRVVFMGFSMSDPYFLKMFDFVSDDLYSYGSDTHYLVLRIPAGDATEHFKRAEQLKYKYGIETVFFVENEQNTGLELFVTELGEKILVKPSPADKEDRAAKNDADATQQPAIHIEKVAVRYEGNAKENGDEAVTEKLLAISNKQIDDED
jgi:hypothetical protein